MNEVKFVLENDTAISDRERRMLNCLANLLGISEQRAIELENQPYKRVYTCASRPVGDCFLFMLS